MKKESVAPLPGLPPGFELELPGRGKTFYREKKGPDGAPTLLLLHGWTATADLNWFTCFDALSENFNVIALDLRGHGRGIRTKSNFKLEDCADDVAALADQLGIATFIPVGYSMGGTIAQLVWQRHEARVRGIVLCSTASHFVESREEKLSFFGLTGLAALSRLTTAQARTWLTDQIYLQRKSNGLSPWAIQQIASHDWRHILEAGSAIGSFDSREWLPTLEAPASVVITTEDGVVAPDRQTELYRLIDDVEVFEVHGGHNAVFAKKDIFVPTLVEACISVFVRSTR
ncbi:MAG: alpha/beta fold hydrolase [Actinomycetota bacterium]